MGKKNTALAVQTAEPSATLSVEFGPTDYEIASVHMGRFYGLLRHHSETLAAARLMIALPLALIRAHDLIHKTKNLQAFYSLAARGGVNVPKMAKRTLERCLQVFDKYIKEKGVSKKDVPALPGVAQMNSDGEQLNLLSDGMPENASPLLRDMLEWARTKGLTLSDTETEGAMMKPPTKTPGGGGDNPQPVDPIVAAEKEAAAWFTAFATYLKTDPHFADEKNVVPEALTAEELAGYELTWGAHTTANLNELVKLCDRWKPSLEALIRRRTGRTKNTKK